MHKLCSGRSLLSSWHSNSADELSHSQLTVLVAIEISVGLDGNAAGNCSLGADDSSLGYGIQLSIDLQEQDHTAAN